MTSAMPFYVGLASIRLKKLADSIMYSQYPGRRALRPSVLGRLPMGDDKLG